jgi:hypothetical protein
MNTLWGGWKMQNLDESHYYQMGSWTEEKQQTPRLLGRFRDAVSERFITIRCRLEALIRPAYATMDQQCSCA